MNAIEQAAITLYRARSERVEAKKALRAYRQQYGGCETPDEIGNPCYWLPSSEQEEWCPVCAGSQPYWLRYRKSAREAGAALNKLMNLCRKLEGGEK